MPILRALLLLAALVPAAQESGPPKSSPGAARAPAEAEVLTPAWEVDAPGPLPWLAALEDRVLVTARGGEVAAHAALTGEALWRARIPSPPASAPVAVAGRLAALTADGSLILLDGRTGALAARAGPFGPGSHLSALPSGLAVADPAGSVTLLDPAEGRILWAMPIQDSPSAPAGQCEETILAGSAQGTVTALTAADGSVRWRRAIGAAITTAPACSRRRAYIGSADNRLHAFRAGRRRANLRWSYLTGGDLAGQPLVFGERVVFVSFDTYLYALDADNGHLSWKVRLGRRPSASGALAGDLLLVAPLNTERLESFRLPAGTQAASMALPPGRGRFVSPPTVAGDMVVIAAADYGQETARVMGLDPRLAAAAAGGGAAGSKGSGR
ncbi:MAG TPA: PQQ-binding-like beta-propeller repeat protein [Candidatus Polarisedimenticolia bacterium]|nr:PQQ-binding-like beta-propeller repeat protein [Candidatus Polarisedimenticolia bacterium]